MPLCVLATTLICLCEMRLDCAPPCPRPTVCGPPVRKMSSPFGPLRTHSYLALCTPSPRSAMCMVWLLRPAAASSPDMWCSSVACRWMSLVNSSICFLTLVPGSNSKSSFLKGTPDVSMLRIMCSRC